MREKYPELVDNAYLIVGLHIQTFYQGHDVDCQLITLGDLFIQIEKTSKLLHNQIKNAKIHISPLSEEGF